MEKEDNWLVTMYAIGEGRRRNNRLSEGPGHPGSFILQPLPFPANEERPDEEHRDKHEGPHVIPQVRDQPPPFC